MDGEHCFEFDEIIDYNFMNWMNKKTDELNRNFNTTVTLIEYYAFYSKVSLINQFLLAKRWQCEYSIIILSDNFNNKKMFKKFEKIQKVQ